MSDYGKGPEIRKGHNYRAFWEGYDRINFKKDREKKRLEEPTQIDIIDEDDYEVCSEVRQPDNGG